MDIIEIMQSQVDVLLCIFGIFMFLVFIVSSRLFCLVILAGLFLSAPRSPAVTNYLITLSVSHHDASNIYVQGFVPGQVYQVEQYKNLTDALPSKKSFFLCSESNRFFLVSMPYGVITTNFVPAGYRLDLNFSNTFYDAEWIVSESRVWGFIRSDDITVPFLAELDRQRQARQMNFGLLLFVSFLLATRFVRGCL